MINVERIKYELLKNRWYHAFQNRTAWTHLRYKFQSRPPGFSPRPIDREGPIRLGVIGAGRQVAKRHLKILRSMPDKYTLIFGVTRTVSSAQSVQTLLEVPCGTKYREMITEFQPDALLVSTREDLLDIICEDCLRMGIHVLCETPGALTSSRLSGFSQFSQQGGAQYMIATHMRFAPVLVRLRARLRELTKKVKDPVHIEITCNGNYRHFFDFLFWLYPGKIQQISASGVLRENRVKIQYEDGSTAQVYSTTLASFTGDLTETITVRVGPLILTASKRAVLTEVEDGRENVRYDFLPQFGEEPSLIELEKSGYVGIWNAFYQVITHGVPSESGIREGVNSIRLYNQIRKKIASNSSDSRKSLRST